MEMTSQHHTLNNLEYETSELKLAALILSELPNCSIDVYEQENYIRKTIKIKYPAEYKNEVSKLENDFINKRASTNVYSYNKALNLIRDRLRGCGDERIERPPKRNRTFR